MLDGPAGALDPDGTAGPDSAEVRERWGAERTAVLCAALEQLLFAGNPDAAVAVQLACPPPEERPGADPAWTDLAATALEYATAADGQPLPLDAIGTDLDTRNDREALAEAWTRLDTALSRAENTTLQNTASLRTHMHLFAGGDGAFTQLKQEVANRRAAGLRDWLRQVPSQGVGKFIDAAATVAAPGQEPMYGAYRKRYVKLLQVIVNETRHVVGLSRAQEGESAPGRRPQGSRRGRPPAGAGARFPVAGPRRGGVGAARARAAVCRRFVVVLPGLAELGRSSL